MKECASAARPACSYSNALIMQQRKSTESSAKGEINSVSFFGHPCNRSKPSTQISLSRCSCLSAAFSLPHTVQTKCKTALTTSRGRDTFRKYASHPHRCEEEDAYLTVPDIDAFPLTCSVDHALGCRRRSSENVRGAAGSGRAAGGGRAHRIDGQAAGRRLFNWNHNTPVTRHQGISKDS